MLAFAAVWAVYNAVTGFGGAEKVKTAEVQSAAETVSDGSGQSAESDAEQSAAESAAVGSTEQTADTVPDSSEAPAQTTPAVTTTRTAYTGWMESVDENAESGSAAVPDTAEITDDFSDAVFIGNSLTVGLSMNCGKPLATFYASTGLNVNTVWDSATIALDDGSYGTVFDALAQKQFGRVYVMFGINEIGWPYWDVFQTNYIEVIGRIKELQPNAKIYIESVLPVSSAAISTDPVFTTENVDAINEYIRKVATDTGATYLDVNSALRQADGSLPEEASTDGIHLMKDYCLIWLKYLADHS